ncbi:MAG: gamma-glutamyltransferase family protein [Gammaproteobacteria bacterium]|nr:gamma-glutamyltransferase family protein [Gammaproteobacteria bacterium]NIR82941.1 gamma-glutamyltransferase family protein [Gammaproteobacteria bacterium]NIR90306.1 gamma-glutamyltransferase family protein [Gammaproteobacteria bacterium]NIU04087.1 gamma-glutamyltransferase family protein [Gammaproteobacteria bacterium]NIV51383.1 gamma-glutamyltransferase family protein [Gammaproteobacteria bacterium]
MTETRTYGPEDTSRTTYAPRLLGTHAAVACEHYLAAQAGADLVKAGGNAVDAAVGAAFVEGVVNPQMHTLGGECPMLIYLAEGDRVIAVNGNTTAPGAATPEAYRARGHTEVPDTGVLAAGVPAAFGALVTALRRFGRLPFEAVTGPARMLAADGFPAHRGLIRQRDFGLRDVEQRFREHWPGSARLYLPQDRRPEEGERIRNPALGALLAHLAAIESRHSGTREARLEAVHDEFYRGEVADVIVRFIRDRDGLLVRADLESFETRLEDPVALDFHDTTVFKCGPWTQGPAMLQALAILAELDLANMGHNSADYLHTVVEAMKLAFADREQYYGDPQRVHVPMAGLLSRDYARARVALIDPRRASPALRPGDPAGGGALLPAAERLGGRAWGPGTVHVDVVDSEGNMASVTPSGAWIKSSEVVPDLGFPLGTRLMTFYLEPGHHPNVVAPGKRPRTTISPTLAFRRSRPWTVFGSMGGDQQDQWMLQYFLNRVIFDMPLQAALEAPKLSSEHFPGFFAPHDFHLQRVLIEPRIPETVRAALARRGHDVIDAVDWTEGFLLAAEQQPDSGLREAGFDLRGWKSEVFPAFALCW